MRQTVADAHARETVDLRKRPRHDQIRITPQQRRRRWDSPGRARYSKYASSSTTITCSGTRSRNSSARLFTHVPVGLFGFAMNTMRVVGDHGVRHRIEIVRPVLRGNRDRVCRRSRSPRADKRRTHAPKRCLRFPATARRARPVRARRWNRCRAISGSARRSVPRQRLFQPIAAAVGITGQRCRGARHRGVNRGTGTARIFVARKFDDVRDAEFARQLFDGFPA